MIDLSTAMAPSTSTHALEMSETAEKAKSLFEEPKPYHDDARRALPVLVRQAGGAHDIEYGILADEVGINGARNTAFPLGCIGQTLIELGRRWGEKIPPLETLAVNKRDRLPGDGVAHFTPDPDAFLRGSRAEKRIIVESIHQGVFAYSRWGDVLKALGLRPMPTAKLPDPRRFSRGGGEGPAHLALKRRIAAEPDLVGASGMAVETEARLLSGDSIDVLFTNRRRALAVEVKSSRSDEDDVVRGVFQCVKYEAVLNAQAKVAPKHTAVDVVLALGGPLTPRIKAIANTLGINVVDSLETPP
jgi:hypothetical protein